MFLWGSGTDACATLPFDEVIAAFRAKAADPIRDKWISDMEAQGLPGQELYDLVMSTLAAAKASN